jgi:taurine dioxygenase
VSKNVEVVPTKAALGAEVRCGDVRKLDDAGIKAVRQAWLDHLVIVIRGQQLADADLVAFGKRFGECQISVPLPSPLANAGKVAQGGRDERHPEVTVVSNVVENGVAQGGLGDGELVWHSDMSSYEAPPNQTILYSIEVPSGIGRTGFNNMYLAWDALPAALRARVDGLMLKHDATIDAAGYIRERFKDAPADIRVSPGAVHPLVRTHPETGRNCLFLGRRSKAYVAGMAVADSDALLDALFEHAAQPRFAWHHDWKNGDILMWDNRCVMHRRDPFDPAVRRTLHRVVVKGTKPFREPGERAAHPRGQLVAA